MLLIFINSIPIHKKHSELPPPSTDPVVWIIIVFLLVRIWSALCRQYSTACGAKWGDALINPYARFQVIQAVSLKITYSGKWCCVVIRVVADVSEYRSACFFLPTHYVNSNLREVLAEWSRVTSEMKQIFSACFSLMFNSINKLFIAAVKYNNIFSFCLWFFWVIPRLLNFICLHFGTLSLFHFHRQIGVKDPSCLSAYKNGTECSETSAYKIQTPGNYPEEIVQHLGTGFSWFPCVYKQMLRWFPRFQVDTTCFSCSPPTYSGSSQSHVVFM
jgi:hypothetical protein